MKYLIFVSCIIISLSCIVAYNSHSTHTEDINLIEGVIYSQGSTVDEFTRHYHVKSEGCTGTPGSILVQGVWMIEGVSNVYPAPYKLSVAISPVYSWDEVEPEIISRINELLEAYELSKSLEPTLDRSQGL